VNKKELEYDWVGQFKEGLCPVNNKYGSINRNNEIVIPIEYDWVGQFKEGLCPVRKDDKWGIINKFNEIVIPSN